MKLLTAAVLSTAMLLTAGPALADRDHGRGHGNDRNHWKQSQHFDKHRGHHYGPPRYVVRRDVHHYYRPAPRYYAPAHVYAPAPVYRPSAGIHVTLPNIYIPLR